jgi:hypothetical protein
LFRLQGYNTPIINPVEPAGKRATLDKQIRAFINRIREQAKRTLSEEHAELFKPGPTPPGNLVGVGLLGRHAGPNFCIASDQATRDQIAQKLVLMGHSIGIKKAQEFVIGNKGLVPIKLIIKGKIGWDNSFKVSQHQRSETPWEVKHARVQLSIPREATFFKCPTCNRCTPNTALNFRRDHLDMKIKCEWCNRMSESATWTCACDIRWYTCAEHRAYQRPLQWVAPKRKVCHTRDCDAEPDKVPKHIIPVPHALMKEDIARYSGQRRLHSQRDDIVLGNAQHAQKKPKLGPILSKRFAGI